MFTEKNRDNKTFTNSNDSDYVKFIDGGICAVLDVEAAGVRNDKYGVSIILCENSDVAGVFTSNKVIAAPVDYTKKIIMDGKISAIVANSGNANCFTGKQGILDCEDMVNLSSRLLNIPSNDIANASTGVIGRKLPMDIMESLIKKACNEIENSNQASINAAKAIMTTDTIYKESAVEVILEDGEVVRIGGICKGTGMIAPNMGTMLCFIATDAIANQKVLKKVLKKSVNDSFNMVIVDGDESTNDTVLLFANGKSNNKISSDNESFENNTIDNNKNSVNSAIDNNSNNNNNNKNSEDSAIDNYSIDKNFQEGLNVLCKDLAKKMAKDGEGATKFLEVEVINAKTKDDAQIAAKSVVKSPLVKTAVFGGDPNWGRIVAAIGYSGADMDPNNVTIAISSADDLVYLVLNGEILAFEDTDNLREAEKLMKNKEIKIFVDLNQGKYDATAFGCDLTYDYVKINAEYTT